MTTRITCPNPACRWPLTVPADARGKMRCPRCYTIFTLAASDQQSAAPNRDKPRAVTLDLPVVPSDASVAKQPAAHAEGSARAVTLDLPAGSLSPTERDDPGRAVTVELPGPNANTLEPAGHSTPPAATLTLGTTLPPQPPLPEQPTRIGRFQVEQLLGEGAFGRVYKAYDPTLKRTVALKVAKPEQLQSADMIARFQREAQSAAPLQHPHIVPVYDSGQDGVYYYIATGFVPGHSLAHELRQLPEGRTLPLRRAAELVRKLAEAMAYAHQQGVIHRDVKPANTMLRQDGEPLLMDFGLAARFEGDERLTRAGSVMGTPEYMAPEQWEGQACAASDQYSLGCLLFELLTGQLPFGGSSPAHYLMLHTRQPAPSPRQVNPRVPRDLATICLKCLEKDPAKRYADCQQMADDLNHFLAGEPIRARSATSAERVWRWCQRNPLEAGLVVAVLVSLLGGLVASLYLMNQANTRAEIARQNAKRAQEETERADRNARESEANATKAKQNEEAAANEARKARLSESHARRSQYVSDINLAQQALESGDVLRALALLTAHMPAPGEEDFRGFEWYHLWKLGHNDLATLPWPHGDVRAMAISPDGRLLAVGGTPSEAGDVRLWDLAGRKELRILKGHGSVVNAVAFAPNGRLLATATGDLNHPGELKLWDPDTGKLLQTLAGTLDPVMSLAFSPDGATLLAGTAKLISGHGSPVDRYFHVDFTRPSSREGGVMLWNVPSGEKRTTLPGVTGDVFSVAWSPSGKLAAAGNAEGKVMVWEVSSGQTVARWTGQNRYVWSLAFAPDGKRLAAASGRWNDVGEVKLWDVETKQESTTLRGHKAGVTAVAFAPDGKRLATGSWDRTIKIWDERGIEVATVYGPKGYVWRLAFTPDSRTLASCSWASMGGSEIKLWDVPRQQTFSFLPKDSRFQAGTYSRSAFNSQIIASPKGDDLGTLVLQDASTGRDRVTIPYIGGMRSVALSPDGKRVALGGFAGETFLCDSGTGQVLAKLPTGSIPALRISPDGKLLATAGDDGSVRLWDMATGRERAALRSHTDVVWCLSFNATGTRLASGSWDQTIKIWDTETFQLLATFKGHKDAIWEVWFLNEDQTLVTASNDGAIGLWEAPRPSDAGRRPGQSLTDAGKKASSQLEKEVTMNLLAAATYQQRGQQAEANQAFRHIRTCLEILLRDCPNFYRHELASWFGQSVFETLLALGKFEDVSRVVDDLLKQNPDSWRVLALKGGLQQAEGKYAEAARTHEAMMESIKKDDSFKEERKTKLINKLRSHLSYLYQEASDFKKAGEYLEGLLAEDPDNPEYNNSLGYMWADHDMNLEKSEKLIRKALEEDRKRRLKKNPNLKPEEVKDNANYLDSLAWVLYKQKKYKEAKAPILEAVKDREGQGTTFYDHLGDIHLALGEKDEALAAWKKALDVNSDRERDKQRKTEIEKKIKMLKK